MNRLITAGVLAAVLVACGSGAEGPATSEGAATATDQVDMARSYRFEPAAISVAPASTVTWTNSDNFTHNVRIDGEVVGEAEPGQTITHTFDEAGTFRYDCSLHPNDMQGTVTVG